MKEVMEFARRVLDGMSKAVVGYSEEVKVLLATLLAGGHALLEGVPGIAKTSIAKGLAKLLGVYGVEYVIDGVRYRGYSRVQFTPDLLPSDIVGTLVFDNKLNAFKTYLGPIFTYLLLADEINRALPRTQSALLQAMQEKEVTIGDNTYKLEDCRMGKWFFVVATQNPIEQEGTFPLPEAQLDRFSVRLIMDYPRTSEEEKMILELHDLYRVEPVELLDGSTADPAEVCRLREVVQRVRVPPQVKDYIVSLVRLTRPKVNKRLAEYVKLGLSPRAGITLMKLAKAWAAMDGREETSREDVEELFYYVANHRIIIKPERVVEEGVASVELVKRILEYVIGRR